MSLVIKLKRIGSKNRPVYRIAVMEKRSKANGKSIAEIGFYNPLVNPPIVKIDLEALTRWTKNGAKISKGVKSIIQAEKQ